MLAGIEIEILLNFILILLYLFRWKYIKDQGLQNPENRRIIMSDHKLYPLFGKEEVTFGEVGKAIHKHLETIRKPVE